MSNGGMDSWLAEFYGTGQPQGDELEKMAQSALLEKLAEGEDIDIDSLSDEEAVELAGALGLFDEEEGDDLSDHEKVAMITKVAEDNGIDISELDEDEFNELAAYVLDPENWEQEDDYSDHEKVAMITKVAEANDIDISDLSEEEYEQLAAIALDPATWEDDEETKEAQAKFAEADFLGRVMAHAQHQELQKIAYSGGTAARFAKRLRDVATGRQFRKSIKGVSRAGKKARKGEEALEAKGRRMLGRGADEGAVKEYLRSLKKGPGGPAKFRKAQRRAGLSAGAGAAKTLGLYGGAGGAGYGAYRLAKD